MVKKYISHISLDFTKNFFKISIIFILLIFILNLFEELSFFKNVNNRFYYSLMMSLLNVPSVFFSILPFVFLITTQFYFMKLFERDELIIFKLNGLSNNRIMLILCALSLILSILLSTVFYNFSAKLKFLYLDLKNQYSKDNKYLAVITENGLWIKDTKNQKNSFINAKQLKKNKLYDVSISTFDEDFKMTKNIFSKEADIKETNWVLKKVQILELGSKVKNQEELIFPTNFNYSSITSLFSNLSSLTFLQLYHMDKKYKEFGYDGNLNLEIHIHKLISYPFYILIMTLLATIIMFNLKKDGNTFSFILIGIFCSVVIYYINYFFNIIGETGKLPIIFSIWIPLIFLFFLSMIGVVNLNEK